MGRSDPLIYREVWRSVTYSFEPGRQCKPSLKTQGRYGIVWHDKCIIGHEWRLCGSSIMGKKAAGESMLSAVYKGEREEKKNTTKKRGNCHKRQMEQGDMKWTRDLRSFGS